MFYVIITAVAILSKNSLNFGPGRGLDCVRPKTVGSSADEDAAPEEIPAEITSQ
jgi:hypothetical protein